MATTDRDERLLVLLLAAEQRDITVPVTLSVRGTVVNGMLASAQRWCQANLDAVDMSPPDSTGAGTVGEIMSRAFTAPVTSSGVEEIGYVHLVDASYWVSASSDAAPVPAGAWRCPVNRVDGWSLGSTAVS